MKRLLASAVAAAWKFTRGKPRSASYIRRAAEAADDLGMAPAGRFDLVKRRRVWGDDPLHAWPPYFKAALAPNPVIDRMDEMLFVPALKIARDHHARRSTVGPLQPRRNPALRSWIYLRSPSALKWALGLLRRQTCILGATEVSMNKTAWGQPTSRVRRAPHTGLRSVVAYLPIESIIPDSNNPRKHSPEQIRAIARSIGAFGFNAPILVDKANRVVAGHGRLEAAKRLNFAEASAIRLEHLSEQHAKASMLADNKLTDRSSWDDRKVAIVLKWLSE